MIDLLQSEVERRVSRHWGLSRGASWSREKHGCRVVLYGLDDEIYRDALDNAEDIHHAVMRIEPAARVRTFTLTNEETGFRSIVIVVRVSAEDLAVFENGPMHRKAVQRARKAVQRAYACASARMRSVA